MRDKSFVLLLFVAHPETLIHGGGEVSTPAWRFPLNMSRLQIAEEKYSLADLRDTPYRPRDTVYSP